MDDKPFWGKLFVMGALLYALVFALNHTLPGGIKGLFDQSQTDYFVQTPENGCQVQTRNSTSGTVISVRPCGSAQPAGQ